MLKPQELIDKTLEVEQLLWWLKYPTLQSFYLRRDWGSDDEGSTWTEQEETRFILSTDIYDPEEFSEDDTYWDYENHSDFGVSAYPCKRESEIYERIYRPQMTDTEMQARINYILSTVGGVSVTQTLGNVSESSIVGLVIEDL